MALAAPYGTPGKADSLPLADCAPFGSRESYLDEERVGNGSDVVRTKSFGSGAWQEAAAKQLGLESTFRSRGRRKKQ